MRARSCTLARHPRLARRAACSGLAGLRTPGRLMAVSSTWEQPQGSKAGLVHRLVVQVRHFSASGILGQCVWRSTAPRTLLPGVRLHELVHNSSPQLPARPVVPPVAHLACLFKLPIGDEHLCMHHVVQRGLPDAKVGAHCSL